MRRGLRVPTPVVTLSLLATMLAGCAPRDVARLTPAQSTAGALAAVRTEAERQVQQQVPQTLDDYTASLAESLRAASSEGRALVGEDHLISFQFGVGYVGLLSAVPFFRSPDSISAEQLAQAAAARYPSRLLGQVRDEINPLLLSREELNRLQAANMHVYAVPVTDSVVEAFQIDDGGLRWLIDQDLAEAWGLKASEFSAIAWQNMWGKTSIQPTSGGEGAHRWVMYNLGDGYDASRMLLTPYIQWIGDQLAGRVVIAAPSQDLLLVFGDDDPYFVASMQEQVKTMYRNMGYGLTPQLFTLEGRRLVPYPIGQVEAPPETRQLQPDPLTTAW